jgi:hypothetical protein
MRTITLCLALLLSSIGLAAPPQTPEKDDPAAGLSRLIHKAVAARLNKPYEDDSGWGHTIPLPDMVRNPRLPRVIVMVDGHPEVPDGLWRKFRFRVADPDRDLRIRVRGLKRIDASTYRLSLDADVKVGGDGEVQRWRNGVLVADLGVRARAALGIAVECEISAKLDTEKVPPGLRLEPEVKELKLDLKEFTPGQVTLRRAGLTLEGGAVQAAGEHIKSALQNALKEKEPELKRRATEALTRALQEGKGTPDAGALLKAAAPLIREQERPPEK